MNKCFGVGLCDVDYNVQIEGPRVKGHPRKVIWRCPYHQTWLSILRRCYSPVKKVVSPSYRLCTVASEWHRLSNFISWVNRQPLRDLWLDNNQLYQIDKDFLLEGNLVYSPETCVILPCFINSLFANLKNESQHPLGVSYKKSNKKFQAQIYSNGRKLYLGLHDDPTKAHLAWQAAKISSLEDAISKYSFIEGHDLRVSDKIKSLIEQIRSDILSGK